MSIDHACSIARIHVLQSQVAEMALRYRECFGEVFRFQIINGTLWVDHISERHDGWFPAREGEGEVYLQYITCLVAIDDQHDACHPACTKTLCDVTGNLAAKGKIPYAILTLMDTLRNHPGQVINLRSPTA